MSDPANPLLPLPASPAEESASVNAGRSRLENPPWSGWNILVLVIIFFVANVFFSAVGILVAIAAQMDGISFAQLSIGNRSAFDPLITDVRFLLPVQIASYAVMILFMVGLVRQRYHQKFFSSVRWNWPHKRWQIFALSGVVLAFAINFFSMLLPIPKSLPMDRFFQNATGAYCMAAFGILVAPLMEELFFRGFLYPVLVRRAGVWPAVALTACAFALLHASQLGNAWVAMLPVFVVGIVLTLLRARTGSVAASLLAHVAYNTTLFSMMYFATEGFRHLERLNQ